MISAEEWPRWYPYAKKVGIVGRGRDRELNETSASDWFTVGVSVRSRVCTLVPHERIVWTATAIGSEIYHAWRIELVSEGRCRVITEETQRGWLPRIAAPIL